MSPAALPSFHTPRLDVLLPAALALFALSEMLQRLPPLGVAVGVAVLALLAWLYFSSRVRGWQAFHQGERSATAPGLTQRANATRLAWVFSLVVLTGYTLPGALFLQWVGVFEAPAWLVPAMSELGVLSGLACVLSAGFASVALEGMSRAAFWEDGSVLPPAAP